MKKFFLPLAFVAAGFVTAQSTSDQTGYVGVNTETPKATLDVQGSPENVNKLDGIIAPRLSGDQLAAKTYTADQTGAIAYATNPTFESKQTNNVNTAGYYYFDGKQWEPMFQEFVRITRKGLTNAGDDEEPVWENYSVYGWGTRYKLENLDKYVTTGNYSVDFTLPTSIRKSGISGTGSFGIGYNNLVSGSSSITGGYNNTVSGSGSITGGYNNTVSGSGSAAFGYQNSASGKNFGSFAIGAATNAIGMASFSAGRGTFAYGNASAALGLGNYTRSFGEVAVGTFNEDYDPVNDESWGPCASDPYCWNYDGIGYVNRAFSIGIGQGNNDGSGNRKDGFKMLKSGMFKFSSWGTDAVAAPVKGAMIVDSDESFKQYDGSTWRKFIAITFANTAPTSPAPEQGDMYFNTTDKKYYAYDGSQWNPLW